MLICADLVILGFPILGPDMKAETEPMHAVAANNTSLVYLILGDALDKKGVKMGSFALAR